MPRRRLIAVAALTLTATLSLSACGGDDEPTTTPASPQDSAPTQSGEQSPDPGSGSEVEQSGTRIELTRTGDVFDPSGARVKVKRGEAVTLVIVSDTAGSLHVHSTPEQDVEYRQGTSTHEVVIDRPGVVEVESHDPDLVVLQLEVR